MDDRKIKRGGFRPGAGRKPEYGIPKKQKTVRLPPEWIGDLVAEFGSFQIAIEALVKRHRGEKCKK